MRKLFVSEQHNASPIFLVFIDTPDNLYTRLLDRGCLVNCMENCLDYLAVGRRAAHTAVSCISIARLGDQQIQKPTLSEFLLHL